MIITVAITSASVPSNISTVTTTTATVVVLLLVWSKGTEVLLITPDGTEDITTAIVVVLLLVWLEGTGVLLISLTGVEVIWSECTIVSPTSNVAATSISLHITTITSLHITCNPVNGVSNIPASLGQTISNTKLLHL